MSTFTVLFDIITLKECFVNIQLFFFNNEKSGTKEIRTAFFIEFLEELLVLACNAHALNEDGGCAKERKSTRDTESEITSDCLD